MLANGAFAPGVQSVAVNAHSHTIVTNGTKLVYQGKWTLGMYDRIQIHANRVGKPVDVWTPHGTLLYSAMPQSEVAND